MYYNIQINKKQQKIPQNNVILIAFSKYIFAIVAANSFQIRIVKFFQNELVPLPIVIRQSRFTHKIQKQVHKWQIKALKYNKKEEN